MLGMSRNTINEGGSRWFDLDTNRMNYFELGAPDSDDYWLEGQLVGPDEEFLFNGRLFVPGYSEAGTVIDNFPKGPEPDGWEKHQNIHRDGYDLTSRQDGTLLFGYRVSGAICCVTTNVYDRDGEIVAKSNLQTLEVYKAPARFGRRGIVFGPAVRKVA